MSNILEDLKYTKDHEWIRMVDKFTAECGITDHAQDLLTDIVFVELPEVDLEVGAEDQIAVVESVKAVSDVYSPLTGRIMEVNESLEDAPEQINSSPYEDGWIFKLEIKDKTEFDELMSSDEYKVYVESGE